MKKVTNSNKYGITHRSYVPDIHRNLKYQSDFWLPSNSKVSGISEVSKLESYQRGIANFVNILTGRSDIRVKFTGDTSHTDGDSITIGSNVGKSDQFDSVCGLSLHEASHIKLSDFRVLRDLQNNTGNIIPGYNYTIDQRGVLKDILNIIEDRRIDNFVYTTCPGYAGYYQAMYDRYFNSPVITKALKSKSISDSTKYDSYIFYLTNMVNPHIDLDSLPDLRKIINLIDLENIGRLKSTEDAFRLAIEVFEIINHNVVMSGKPQPDNSQKDKSSQSGNPSDSTDSDDSSDDSDSDSDESGDSDSGNGFGDGTDEDSSGDADALNGSAESPQTGSNDISDSLRKAINMQHDFLDSNVKKTKITKQVLKELDNIKSSKVEFKDVQIENHWGNKLNISTIIINKFTEATTKSDIYKDGFGAGGVYVEKRNQLAIDEGLALGAKLGKKLQIRNDETTIINNRKNSGYIDKRMLHSFGYDNDAAFMVKQLIKFPAASIHISIDASGSMGMAGKWVNAQKTAAAIAKAASMISNFDVVISYRSISDKKPIVLIAYNSKVDKISKIKNLFAKIECAGGATPEGLCYASISKMIQSNSNDKVSYLINISDGEPNYRYSGIEYVGDIAIEHTKREIDTIRKTGVKIISYLVGCNDSAAEMFKRMYGKDAISIDTTQLGPLAKSLNEKFTQK